MSKIVQFSEVLERRYRRDGYANLLTGYGTNRDHGKQFSFQVEPRLNKTTLDAIHAQHPIAWKLTDLLVLDAVRNWIDIQDDDSTQLQNDLKKAGYKEAIVEAGINSRTHGGAAIYQIYEDDQGFVSGNVTAENVLPDRPLKLISCEPIECDYIWPHRITRSFRFDHYKVGLSEDTAMVHKSRIQPFYGIKCSRDWLIYNGGWPEGVLERLRWPLIFYSITHGLVPNIMKDFIRDVIKIDGLQELALNSSDDDMAAFRDRLDAMYLAESLINKQVLDKNDDIVRQSTSVAGLNDLIRNPEKYLAAGSGMPMTKLFGEGQTGASLSQSGESTGDRDWNQIVSSYQEDILRPKIGKTLFNMTGRDVQFRFNPLDVPSKAKQAEVLDKIASAIEKLIRNQVITPEEAATMLEGNELKMLPVLDMASRNELNQINSEDLQDG